MFDIFLPILMTTVSYRKDNHHQNYCEFHYEHFHNCNCTVNPKQIKLNLIDTFSNYSLSHIICNIKTKNWLYGHKSKRKKFLSTFNVLSNVFYWPRWTKHLNQYFHLFWWSFDLNEASICARSLPMWWPFRSHTMTMWI